MLDLTATALDAASLPLASNLAAADPGGAARLLDAAQAILLDLAAGRAVDTGAIRAAMQRAFGGSDAHGAWRWKDSYEACEAAEVLFLRRFGPAMRAKPAATQLAMLAKVAALVPSQTRRSEESQALQQFSAPIGLGLVAARAAALAASDLALEPSAGTGLLAIFAELAGASLILNELGGTRADLLAHLFPAAPVTRQDAAFIDDHLDPALRPSVVLMNPPFSAAVNVDGRVADAALRHIGSALARLAEGGRLVAITGANLSPEAPRWQDAFARLQERGTVVFTAAIDGRVYARHGTTTETRLTVIDRLPAADPTRLPASFGLAPDLATLLGWVDAHVPPRQPCTPMHGSALPAPCKSASPALRNGGSKAPAFTPVASDAVLLAYETCDWSPAEGGRISASLYEPYALQSLRIAGAQPHPTPLVQSAAMASVAPTCRRAWLQMACSPTRSSRP